MTCPNFLVVCHYTVWLSVIPAPIQSDFGLNKIAYFCSLHSACSFAFTFSVHKYKCKLQTCAYAQFCNLSVFLLINLSIDNICISAYFGNAHICSFNDSAWSKQNCVFMQFCSSSYQIRMFMSFDISNVRELRILEVQFVLSCTQLLYGSMNYKTAHMRNFALWYS